MIYAVEEILKGLWVPGGYNRQDPVSMKQKPIFARSSFILGFAVLSTALAVETGASVITAGRFAGSESPDFPQLSSRISQLVVGSSYSAAVTEDGETYYFRPGELPNGDWDLLEDIGPVRSLHGTALSLWAVGDSGNTFRIDRDSTPSVIRDLENVVKVALTLFEILILHDDGTVSVYDSERGRPPEPAMRLPELSAPVPVIDIAAGDYHFMTLDENGDVRVWGENYNREQSIPAVVKNVKAIASGSDHCVALLENGTVICWGSNAWGQCNTPAGMLDIVTIAAGGLHSIAVGRQGRVWAWGSNIQGETDIPEMEHLVDGITSNWGVSVIYTDGGQSLSQKFLPPRSQIIRPGVSVSFQVDIPDGIDSQSTAYQWTRDGAIIEGTEGPSFVVEDIPEQPVTGYAVSIQSGDQLIEFEDIYLFADRDADGLADWIELAEGSDPLIVDSNEDGLNDLLEFFNHTRTYTAGERSRSIPVILSGPAVFFQSSQGYTYRLLASGDLENWNPVGPEFAGNGAQISWRTNPNNALGHQFYQLTYEPPAESPDDEDPEVSIIIQPDTIEFLSLQSFTYILELSTDLDTWEEFGVPFSGSGFVENLQLPEELAGTYVRLRRIQPQP